MKDKKMKTPTRILTTLAILASTFLYSCQKSTKNELSDAQLCLNTASADTALGCVSGISSNVEPLAYSLRCSAIFISQGFGDAASFVNALDSINSSSNCTGTCSATVNALNALKFEAAGTTLQAHWDANNAAAADAFVQCSQADAKIYTQIASLFRLGTLTTMLAYKNLGATYTQDQLALQLANLTPEDVGAIVSITYANTCQNIEDASDSTVAYCAELALAFNSGSSEADIGACLIGKLQNPAHVCP